MTAGENFTEESKKNMRIIGLEPLKIQFTVLRKVKPLG